MSGKITISTITPSTYPWNGTYFKGIPIQIEAIADSGYIFSHWDANPIITNVQNPVFTTSLTTSNFNFTANFIPDPTAGFVSNKSEGILVYPNPANTNITIKLNEDIQAIEHVELVAMDGRIVLNKAVSNHAGIVQLDCTLIPSGIYSIRVIGQNRIKVLNVAIQH
jgi:hypothetical protein